MRRFIVNDIFEYRNKSLNERFDYLVKTWRAEAAVKNGTSIQVIGTYKKADKLDRNGNEYGFFEDVRDLNGDVLFYPFNLGPVKIYTRHRASLLNAPYWLITVELSDRNYDNPFELSLTRPILFNIPKNSFKDKIEKEQLIKHIFEQTGYTKTDARNEANALRRLMGDLYTETERFIFELLQNADDQPNGTSRVEAHLCLYENQLVFTHNGKPFDKTDVESICSIGDSTKKSDVEKIGYKGIGFKSVFSDSDTVYIHSGNFSFAFDKDSWYYKDIENIDEVPWQIKPIWAERYKYPLSVQENGTFFNASVGIVIGISKEKSEEYSKLIPDLLSEPRFLLFLRNIDCLLYTDYIGHSFKIKKRKSPSGAIELIINDAIHSSWITSDFIIDVPQETREGIENDKLIPAKLKDISKVKISFSAMLSPDGHLIKVPEDESILFTYLPTKVNDFKFPFLVNTDFLTTASRETIHYKNHWNVFLFEQIGAHLLDWVVSMKQYGGDYLSLIPEPESDIDEKQPKSNLLIAFTQAFNESIENSSFILSDTGELCRPSELILDKSKLSSIVGREVFYNIVGTPKHLPADGIDQSIFNQSYYTEVETLGIKELSSILVDNDPINLWYKNASEEAREDFINWLSEHSDKLSSAISTIGLFEHNGEMVSANDLTLDNGYLVITEALSPIASILETVGFKCIGPYSDESKLSEFVPIQAGKKVFGTITSNDSLIELTINDKVKLVAALANLENVGSSSISEIPLFRNACDEIKPLAHLTAYLQDAPGWLLPYVIAESENDDSIQEYLVSKEDVFEKLIFPQWKEIDTDINSLFNYFRWSDSQYTRSIVDSISKDKDRDLSEPIDIIISSDKETQKYYLGKIGKVFYSSEEEYKRDSFGSKIIQLALSIYDNPASEFSPKVYFDGVNILDFSVSDSVKCGYSTAPNRARIVTLSLAKILPEYASKSDSINRFKNLFEYKAGLDKLFVSKEKSLDSIYEELNRHFGISHGYSLWRVNGNASQFLFSTFYRRQIKGWNNAFVPDIRLEDQSESFVNEMMDIIYGNNMSIPSSPFTYKLSQHIVGKYFSNNYVTEAETLNSKIENWADTEEKKDYLLRNGVKSNDCMVIKFRRAFIEDQNMSEFDGISDEEALASLKYFLDSEDVSFPVMTENRIAFLTKLTERTSLPFFHSVDDSHLREISVEVSSPEYIEWNKRNSPDIYLIDGQVPRFAWMRGSTTTLVKYTSGDYYYDSHSRKLYINSHLDFDEILFRIAREGKSCVDLDDYRILCREGKTSIRTEELNSLYQTRDELLVKNQEQAELIQEYERRLGISTGTSATEFQREVLFRRGADNPLSKALQCDAQLEAQRALMKQMPEWGYPEHYGEMNEDGKPYHFSTVEIQTENGTKPIVLKSYKNTSEPFKINPNEWISLMDDDADLLIYTGDDIKIYPMKKMILDQSKVTVSFSTDNMDVEERVDALAESLRYFSDITFDFASFILSDRAKSIKAQYNIREGKQNNPSEEAL